MKEIDYECLSKAISDEATRVFHQGLFQQQSDFLWKHYKPLNREETKKLIEIYKNYDKKQFHIREELSQVPKKTDLLIHSLPLLHKLTHLLEGISSENPLSDAEVIALI